MFQSGRTRPELLARILHPVGIYCAAIRWLRQIPCEVRKIGQEFDRRREFLADALKGLNEREKRIFLARRLSENPLTLEELSTEFGVSRERIRQIEVRAFEKVQKAVQKAAAAADAPAAVH